MSRTCSNSSRPIFVFGMNRCGTKWLSNLLANHTDITAVQAPEYQGIVECDLLSEVPLKFNLDSEDDHAAFLALWNLSDFVRIAGVDVTSFARMNPIPRTASDLLKALMERYSSNEGTSRWLQKFGPESLDMAMRHFPNASYVFITRNALDVIHSTHALSRREGSNESYASIAFGFVLGEKKLTRAMCGRHCCVTTYERLSQNTDSEVQRICGFLGVAYSDEMSRSRFDTNSSFSRSDKKPRLNAVTRCALQALVTALRWVPESILRAYANRRPYARRTASFVPDSFRTLRRSIRRERTLAGPVADSIA